MMVVVVVVVVVVVTEIVMLMMVMAVVTVEMVEVFQAVVIVEVIVVVVVAVAVAVVAVLAAVVCQLLKWNCSSSCHYCHSYRLLMYDGYQLIYCCWQKKFDQPPSALSYLFLSIFLCFVEQSIVRVK